MMPCNYCAREENCSPCPHEEAMQELVKITEELGLYHEPIPQSLPDQGGSEPDGTDERVEAGDMVALPVTIFDQLVQVVSHVSTGKSFAFTGQGPYPDPLARRALGALDDRGALEGYRRRHPASDLEVIDPHRIGEAHNCPEGCPTHNPGGPDVPDQTPGAIIAYRIRAELVCCRIYDRVNDDHELTLREAINSPGRWHDLCYWGEAAARIAEEWGS